MAIRKLTAAEVTFTVTVEADENATETDIRGSFATDEPDLDREQADEILRRLRAGDETAYCGVLVTATWEFDGEEYSESDSIWGCTLSDDYTAETVADHHGMREQALASLNGRLYGLCLQHAKLARKLRARKAS